MSLYKRGRTYRYRLRSNGQQYRGPCKTLKLSEAEAVAFVVCQAIGLETGTAAADYIQLWHGDASLLRESLEAVQQTAAAILGGIALEVPAVAAAT